jgi:hypothetical protein
MTRSFVMLAWAGISLSLATCAAHAGGNDEIRVPRSASPIKFEPQLELKSKDSKTRILDPKHAYVAYVTKGDAIDVSITPEENVFVYLGYCDRNKFALYPEAGRQALRAQARHTFKLPVPYDIDDDRVLYAIASRTEVSLASPDLTIAIAQSREAVGRRAMDGDCAEGSGDGTGSQASSLTTIIARPADTAIKAVRYELRRPAAR